MPTGLMEEENADGEKPAEEIVVTGRRVGNSGGGGSLGGGYGGVRIAGITSHINGNNELVISAKVKKLKLRIDVEGRQRNVLRLKDNVLSLHERFKLLVQRVPEREKPL